MKNHRNLVIGVVLLFIGVTGLNTLPFRSGMPMGGIMEGGRMMGGEGMKAMMKEMMGAQLPPGIDPSELPEATSNGARLLGQYCTQCHEMPSPGMHTAEEWSRVVNRMTQHMDAMGKPLPHRESLEAILAFLQKHAK